MSYRGGQRTSAPAYHKPTIKPTLLKQRQGLAIAESSRFLTVNGANMKKDACVLVLIVFSLLLAEGNRAEEEVDVVSRDRNFVAYSNAIVKDTTTGLEWIAGPDVDTSYYKAAEWVRRLAISGGGWRMPDARELSTLYRKPGVLASITPLLKTTGTHVWPRQDNEDLSLYLFRYMDPYGTRAFAVRSGNDQR